MELGYSYRNDGNRPSDVPLKLAIDGGLEAVLDELRISDVQRYSADFAPPSRYRELAADEHTRALFHFNGSLDGENHVLTGTVVGRIEP